MSKVSPWYSPVQPKPLYESGSVKAFWDVAVFAENTEVRANRVDARIINHETRSVTLLEMSCPWLDNQSTKDEEKSLKYGPLITVGAQAAVSRV